MHRLSALLLCLLACSMAFAAPAEQPAPATPPVPDEEGTGLRAEYYESNDFTSLKLVRLDKQIDHDWNGSPAPGVRADYFTVRWTGKLLPLYSETYTFEGSCDDNMRVWVKGELVMAKWSEQQKQNGAIALTAGEKVDIKVEFYENTGPASIHLNWSSPSQKKEAIPASQLFPPLIAGGQIAYQSPRLPPTCAIYLLTGDGAAPKALSGPGEMEPTFPATGTRLAYTSGRHTGWKDPKTVKNTELYLMNTDGTGQIRITRDPMGDAQPAFSADGRKIAFASNRNLNWDIYLVNYDGSKLQRLTEDKMDDQSPSVSPDGKQVVFQSCRDGQWELYLVDGDGGNEHRLTTDGGQSPAFSPNGAQIAYAAPRNGTWAICLYTLASGETTTLFETLGVPDSPAFSPDGAQLVFAMSSNGGKTSDLYVTYLEEKKVYRLTNSGNCFQPSWGR
ncbi:MAG: PA14 domain-containing protein [Armatimonadota bacterium]